MSFGLSRGRTLDPGPIAVPPALIPPMPDDVLTNRAGAHLPIHTWFEHPDRPLHLEIGSGKGTFLMQAAPRQPGVNFLGIEYAQEFYFYAADRLRRAMVPNVRMMGIDAAEFLHWRVPDNCLHTIHLYFPDPWPKSRHHRRRMVQDRFMLDAARTLVDGGELRVVTDHADYWAWMEEHFARFTPPAAGAPFTREVLPPAGADLLTESGQSEIVGTNFERKYRAEGRTFNAALLRRVARVAAGQG